MRKFFLTALILCTWLTAVSPSAAQEDRNLVVGTWCDHTDNHVEVYNRDGTVIWTFATEQLRGDWFWLPIPQDVLVIQFEGRGAIFLELVVVTPRRVIFQSVRTRRFYVMQRGRCT